MDMRYFITYALISATKSHFSHTLKADYYIYWYSGQNWKKNIIKEIWSKLGEKPYIEYGPSWKQNII